MDEIITVTFQKEDLKELLDELYEHLEFELGESLILQAVFDRLNIDVEDYVSDDPDYFGKKALKVLEGLK